MTGPSKQTGRGTADSTVLVSIVTPVFNASEFLPETIRTVQDQSHTKWELLFVDDGSSDTSVSIIKKARQTDARILLLRNKRNRGAGYSRNRAIQAAKGEYIAFLDADDLWDPRKLEKQLTFAEADRLAFTFTAYEFASADGASTGSRVQAPQTVTYRSMLTNPIAWTSTIMVDMRRVTKETLYMPDIPRGQDLVAWLAVLHEVGQGYGLNEPLSYYRRTADSLSANKFKAMQRTWFIYRHILGIKPSTSLRHMAAWGFNATRKRI